MKMLVLTVGSQKYDATLRFASKMATALAAETTLMGLVPRGRTPEDLYARLQEHARALTALGLPVQVIVLSDDPEEVAMSELQQAVYDIVVIGALGGFRARRSLFEPLGMRLVQRVTGAVLVVKGDRPSLSRVLICASGYEGGRAAIRMGAVVSCAAHADTTILHVLETAPAMYTGLERIEETLEEFLQSDTEASNELRWAAEAVSTKCRAAELKLRRGIVADEILREGREGDYDLIVLGSSRSTTGLFRMLMGDLTRTVMGRAKRPVLIVPAVQPRPSARTG